MTDATRAERAAASRVAYDIGSQRTTELDLAFNGLVDQRTFADPRHAGSAEDLTRANLAVNSLLGRVRGRQFTDSEQAQWASALGEQAAYYAAEEEGRAR